MKNYTIARPVAPLGLVTPILPDWKKHLMTLKQAESYAHDMRQAGFTDVLVVNTKAE